MVVFDLDDTLYKERDYVESGNRAVMAWLRQMHPSLTEQQLRLIPWGDEELRVYRNHFPGIKLPAESRAALDALKSAGVPMAIITDGRSVQQRNKYRALGLDDYIPPERLLISEEVGARKTEPDAFLRLMEMYPQETDWLYVGDNVAKDFFHPNRLGWRTAMLLDPAAFNIHPQQGWQQWPPSHQPQFTIPSLKCVLT
ncbi:MAG: HAD family hydrolase [Bacteroidales bacterium]|nr:HAD family hydrolase [Bacteroidales bacterium]